MSEEALDELEALRAIFTGPDEFRVTEATRGNLETRGLPVTYALRVRDGDAPEGSLRSRLFCDLFVTLYPFDYPDSFAGFSFALRPGSDEDEEGMGNADSRNDGEMNADSNISETGSITDNSSAVAADDDEGLDKIVSPKELRILHDVLETRVAECRENCEVAIFVLRSEVQDYVNDVGEKRLKALQAASVDVTKSFHEQME
eukprot:g1789.t1